MKELAVGTLVGAHRWPMEAAHPDAWLKPWPGVVLDVADPVAWFGTIAFHEMPTAEQVQAHLDRLASLGIQMTKVPVLWDFGQVFWEMPGSLMPYEQDLKEWQQALELKRSQAQTPVKRA